MHCVSVLVVGDFISWATGNIGFQVVFV